MARFTKRLALSVFLTGMMGIVTGFSGYQWAQRLDEGDQRVELGHVNWHKDFDKARALARQKERPLFVLFTEVPGCSTVKGYGRSVLSHPQIADAIEQAFVPVVVYNNKRGKHRRVLKSFNEPTWNNPAVRIIQPDRSMIVPRLYGNYSKQATVRTIVEALNKTNREIPAYLQLLHRQFKPTATNTAIFTMYCYWTGEARIGQLPSVVATKPGYIDGHEGVEVVFNSAGTKLQELAQKVKRLEAASAIYVTNKSQLKQVEPIFEEAKRTSPRAFRYNPDADNYHLQGSPYQALTLTELQTTRINSAVGLGKKAQRYLSPSQRQQMQ